MVDQFTADKGWTIEYILSLTYRQVGCLYERMWDRIVWNIEKDIATNPLAGSDDEEEGVNLFDATSDEGMDEIAQKLGVPIKTRTAKA